MGTTPRDRTGILRVVSVAKTLGEIRTGSFPTWVPNAGGVN